MFVDNDQPVGITVKRNPNIRARSNNGLLKRGNMR